MEKETVLITGASSGIGLELARLFAKGGSDLVLVARTEKKLQQLADELRKEHGVAVEVLASDLTRSEAPGEIWRELERRRRTVDVVVNNAGFGARGSVAELPLERQLEMLQVNITALTHLTRLFLPGMLERKKGGILNVASTAAFQPGPNMTVYYATKAYVLSFSEGLSEEVAGTGVTISCLAPGATETGFSEEANMQGSLLFRMGTMKADGVARAGYEGFRCGRAIVIPGLKNQLGAFSVRFTPRFLMRKITKHLQS